MAESSQPSKCQTAENPVAEHQSAQDKTNQTKNADDGTAEDVLPAFKKFYTDMAGTLIPLATFAGGLTLATQFIIKCPQSRLQSLLALAAQLFLATPLALLPVYLLLYGLGDQGVVKYDSKTHAVVCTQFVISGVMLSAGFVLIGTAIYVAEEPPKMIGSWGLGLLGLLLFLGIMAGLVRTKLWKWVPGLGSNTIIWRNVWLGVLLGVVQLAVVCLLLGFGGRAASRAKIQSGCT